jgi:hypothetical protein
VKYICINFFTVVSFEVLTVASMKMPVFWVAAPCSLAGVYRRFRGACFLHHQGLSPDATTQKTVIFFNVVHQEWNKKKWEVDARIVYISSF